MCTWDFSGNVITLLRVKTAVGRCLQMQHLKRALKYNQFTMFGLLCWLQYIVANEESVAWSEKRPAWIVWPLSSVWSTMQKPRLVQKLFLVFRVEVFNMFVGWFLNIWQITKDLRYEHKGLKSKYILEAIHILKFSSLHQNIDHLIFWWYLVW